MTDTKRVKRCKELFCEACEQEKKHKDISNLYGTTYFQPHGKHTCGKEKFMWKTDKPQKFIWKETSEVPSWEERLYDEKPFLVPNGGDIRKVEITYKDWIWIKDFISQTIISERESAVEEERKRIVERIGQFGRNTIIDELLRIYKQD